MVRQITRGRGRPGKPTNFRPAVIHATLERRDPNSSLCFQFGQYDPADADHHAAPQGGRGGGHARSSIVWQIGMAALYVIVGGAVLRTLYYQYQINELSAEMVDATSLRQANLERLESVRKEMAGLSEDLSQLKQRNSGLRKEQRDLNQEMKHAQEEEEGAKHSERERRDILSPEEMGNI